MVEDQASSIPGIVLDAFRDAVRLIRYYFTGRILMHSTRGDILICKCRRGGVGEYFSTIPAMITIGSIIDRA